MKTTNFKWLLGAVLSVGLLFTACTKDNGVPGGGTDPEGEMGYFAVNIKDVTGGKFTKADALETDLGTGEESNINTVYVVLYRVDAMGNPTTVAYHWNMTSQMLITDQQTVGKQVVKADYKLLVMLNPSAEAIAAADEDVAYTVFQTALANTTADNFTMGSSIRDNFMMCNWQGLVDVDKDDDIYGSKAAAEASPSSVFVERVVAKIMVGYDTNNFSTPAGVTLSAPEWAVDVVNKKTYFMRNLAQAITTPGVGFVLGDEYTIPDMRHRHYATDPNFTGISWKNGVTGPGGGDASSPLQLFNNFSYLGSTGTFTNVPNTANATNYGVHYVLENTMQADEQWRDVTTAVIFKMKYTPTYSSILKDDSPNNPIGADVGYFIFKNYVMAAKDLDDIISGDLIIRRSDYEALYDALTIAKLTDYRDNVLSVVSFAAFAADAGNAAQNIGTEGLMYVNADQINYYRVPIRHYDEAIQPVLMAYGRFGVVRNNVYILHFRGVNGPGVAELEDPDDPDTPGPKDPDEEPDLESSWISVEFEILPWVKREHPVIVG